MMSRCKPTRNSGVLGYDYVCMYDGAANEGSDDETRMLAGWKQSREDQSTQPQLC